MAPTEREIDTWKARYPPGHAFTSDEVRRMSPAEFSYFKREVLEQQGSGLIRETDARLAANAAHGRSGG